MACGRVRGRYRRAAERARSAAGGVRGSCGARARCVRDRANACAGRAGSGVVRPSAAGCEGEGRAHRANACECVRARWKAAGGGRPGLRAAVRGRMRWGAEGAAECGRMRPSAGSLGRMRLGWVACVRVGPNAVELTGGCARRWRRLADATLAAACADAGLGGLGGSDRVGGLPRVCRRRRHLCRRTWIWLGRLRRARLDRRDRVRLRFAFA